MNSTFKNTLPINEHLSIIYLAGVKRFLMKLRIWKMDGRDLEWNNSLTDPNSPVFMETALKVERKVRVVYYCNLLV